jgi:anti-sigma regulatory factor (Ser/Thr protein kinase)
MIVPLATREVFSLAPSRRAPAQARAAVRAFAEPIIGDEAAGTAELLVSELVTNALTHGRGTITVQLEHGSTGLLITVCDDEPTHPEVPPQVPLALGGRGLRMVEVLADDWGITPAASGPGKGVWFRVS